MEESSRRQVVGFCALLLVVISLVYGNTLHSPFTLDDSMVIKTEIAQTGEKYFQPIPPRYRHLFYLSFAINYAQGQLEPLGYHLVNISIHYLTSLVIFFISYFTIKRGTEWGRQAAPIAILTTLFFALSPVHTETVTYISGRSSGLAGFFYFASLLLFILAGFRERATKSRLLFYLLSVVLFMFAVLSKETSLTLPAVILLYDFCFMKGEKWSPRKNRVLLFYLPLLISATFGALLMKAMIIDWWGKIDFSYALQQSRIIGHGLYLLLFPIGLTFDTDFPDVFFPHPALSAWPLVLLAGFIASVTRYFPQYTRLTVFSISWFLLTIAPTNSFLPRLDLLSERNLYIPSFGIFLLMASFATSLLNNLMVRKAAITCLVAGLVFQMTLLFDRNTTYKSSIALWEDTVKKAPGKTRAWQNLSHHYLMTLNYEKAYESLQGLINSNPSPKFLSQAHSKLGVIHGRQGRFPEAIASHEKAIRLNPTFPFNYLNLGGVYLQQGDFLKAKDTYEKAENLFKSGPSWRKVPHGLYLNKAHILFRLGLYGKAETAAHTYLSLAPGSKSGHSILGYIYLAMRKKEEAAQEFAKSK